MSWRGVQRITYYGTHIVSGIHRVKGHGGITVSGAILHVLTAGNRFDLTERRLLPT